jgi:hypothetical protein
MFLRIVSLVLALYNGDLDHQNGSHAGGAGGNEQKEGFEFLTFLISLHCRKKCWSELGVK